MTTHHCHGPTRRSAPSLRRTLRVLGAWLVLLAAAGAGLRAADPPSSSKKSTPPAPKPDASWLPTDAVWVVLKEATDPFRNAPTGIFLTPTEYKRLLGIETAYNKLQQSLTPGPATPSKCHLKGKIAGNVVLLEAQFDFETSRPNTLVFVACNPARASNAVLDGATPFLKEGTDGFRLQVEKAGAHQLSLDLVLGLTAKGNGWGFTLDLPRAAVTALDLELPGGVKDVRIGGRAPAEALATITDKGRRLQAAALGSLDKLDVSWRGAHATPKAPPVRKAEGKVVVELDAHGLMTEARLTLRAEGAPANQWHLLVPVGAEVKVTDEDNPVARIEKRDHKGFSERILHLKEPSLAALPVMIRTHAPAPRPGSVTPVGLFAVLGASKQTGTLEVRNARSDLRLDFRAHGRLTRRPLPEDDPRGDLVAAFTYWNVNPLDSLPRGGTPLAWLDLVAEAVRGQMQTQVRHTLTLRPEVGGQSRWGVMTAVRATPRWADVEQLKILMPAGCTYVDGSATPTPAARVRKVEFDAAAGVVTFTLNRTVGEGSPKEFAVTVQGTMALPADATRGQATLPLPRPLGTVDQGGEVEVRVPRLPRPLELTVSPENNPTLEPVRQTPHEQTWKSSRAPEQVVVAWRPYRPGLRVVSVADVKLGEREGRVKHEVRLQFAQPGTAQVAVRVPRGLKGTLSVAKGGSLAAGGEEAGGVQRVTLDAPPGQQHTLILEYRFALEGKDGWPVPPGEPFAVPLVEVQGATAAETRVRVWSERPGFLPIATERVWSQQRLERVRGEAWLPALVLSSRGGGVPLVLRFGETEPRSTVLVHWARMQVEVRDNGAQRWRARFLLSRLASRHLDVELPAPVATLGLRATLGDKRVGHAVVGEADRQAEGGRVARLQLSPDLVGGRTLLDLEYEVVPGRADSGVVRTTLVPPVLRGAPERVPTVWQVATPATWVTVGPEAEPALRRTWARRGWLLAPALAVTPADLDRPFGEADAASSPEADSFPAPALVCRRDELGPLTLTHAPQQGWLLVCSLGLLVVGLGLLWLARPAAPGAGMAPWLWPVLAVLALAVAVASLFWPSLMATVAYGCEPGAGVLAVVAGVQWLLHQRYRRQIVFLPSFSRSRAGSAMLRSSSSPRPHGEPSTVDAPQPVGSSARSAGTPRREDGSGT